MRPLAIVIGVSWICFWLYWAASAVGAKKGRLPSDLKPFLGIRLSIVLLAAVLTLLFNRLSLSFKDHPFGVYPAVRIIGFIVFVCGITLAVWARIYLGKNWGMPMTEKQEPELVTSGPYRYVRHPIYTGILAMSIGSAAVVNGYWLLVFAVATVYFIYSAVMEERLMVKQFPKAYPSYKAKTKMLIPFIF